MVSLTTIGFGDYAPSFITDSGFLSVYRMMALCWLLIGLAWLGGLLSLMTTLFGEIQNSIFIGPIKLKVGILEISDGPGSNSLESPITLQYGDLRHHMHQCTTVVMHFLIRFKTPSIKADYEAKNLHSNEQMKSIKRVRRNQNRQTSLEQKRRDREEEIKRRNGNRRVKYMHNIEL